MKLPSPSVIESLRDMRSAVELLTAANSAMCAAQTQMRISGMQPVIDMAAMVQSELTAASRRYRDAYRKAQAGLDESGCEYLANRLQ